tara:strand:+ start:21 stop:539 length:519 start_codon:yes stop_codon:yes gene_type:complete
MKLTRKIKKGRKIKKSKSRVKRRTFHKKKTKRYTRRKRRRRKKRGGTAPSPDPDDLNKTAWENAWIAYINSVDNRVWLEQLENNPNAEVTKNFRIMLNAIITNIEAAKFVKEDHPLHNEIFVRKIWDSIRRMPNSKTTKEKLQNHIPLTPRLWNDILSDILPSRRTPLTPPP